jgi:hypothetical protein
MTATVEQEADRGVSTEPTREELEAALAAGPWAMSSELPPDHPINGSDPEAGARWFVGVVRLALEALNARAAAGEPFVVEPTASGVADG